MREGDMSGALTQQERAQRGHGQGDDMETWDEHCNRRCEQHSLLIFT